MAKRTLTRPLTALIVGCIDDISKSVGKLFDNPRYTDDRNNNPNTDDLDLIVVITKAVSHRLIEHWHEFGRTHDILVVNGDSKSTIIERLNELATILEPQKSEPRLKVVPVSYNPSQPVEVAPQPSAPPQSSTAPAGSSISAFMAEVQGLQKAKEEAEAVALKEMERADKIQAELDATLKKIPDEAEIQRRIEEAVEKRADGLAIQKTREIDSELKQLRKTLEEKIKEVGRAEKRKEKAEEEKRKAQETIDNLEEEIDELKAVKSKLSITPHKLRLMMYMSQLTAAMLSCPDKVLTRFERMFSLLEEDTEINAIMTEVAINAGSSAVNKEHISVLLDALTQKKEGENHVVIRE